MSRRVDDACSVKHLPTVETDIQSQINISLQFFLGACERMDDTILEPTPVLSDDFCKVATGVAVMQEHGQPCHLGQFEMTVEILQLCFLWTKEESIVI